MKWSILTIIVTLVQNTVPWQSGPILIVEHQNCESLRRTTANSVLWCVRNNLSGRNVLIWTKVSATRRSRMPLHYLGAQHHRTLPCYERMRFTQSFSFAAVSSIAASKTTRMYLTASRRLFVSWGFVRQ